MADFISIIAQIAAALSITPLDVYVFFWVFVCLVIFIALGLARIYSTFFGIVLGMGIFVLLSTILSPEFQTPETLSLVSQTFAKLLIGSSVYLIFILALLVPMNGGVAVTLPKNIGEKIFQTIVLSGMLVFFILAIILGLVEKSYIFLHTDSAFSMLRKTILYSELQSSIIFHFTTSHLPTIIIISIGFIIYKLLLADIINALLTSLIANLQKQKTLASMGGGGDHGGGHDDHGWWHDDHGGHDDHGSDGHDDDHGWWHDDHGGHDDHGHH